MVRMELVIRSLNSPPDFPPQNWELLPEEMETLRDAIRLLKDTREHWKAGHRVSVAAKLAALSAEAQTRRMEAATATTNRRMLREIYDK